MVNEIATGRRLATAPINFRPPAGSPPVEWRVDDDLVVVDKPVGVAAHPSPGWTGPTVIGGLAAAGYTIATSGVMRREWASCAPLQSSVQTRARAG